MKRLVVKKNQQKTIIIIIKQESVTGNQGLDIQNLVKEDKPLSYAVLTFITFAITSSFL